MFLRTNLIGRAAKKPTEVRHTGGQNEAAGATDAAVVAVDQFGGSYKGWARHDHSESPISGSRRRRPAIAKQTELCFGRLSV